MVKRFEDYIQNLITHNLGTGINTHKHCSDVTWAALRLDPPKILLLNGLFWLTTKKNQSPGLLSLCGGIQRVDYPHTGPVLQTSIRYHDIITLMCDLHIIMLWRVSLASLCYARITVQVTITEHLTWCALQICTEKRGKSEGLNNLDIYYIKMNG